MIEIPPIFDSFKEKQVPTFVVSRFNKFETIFLVSFYFFCLIYGWYTYTHILSAEKFLIFLVVPITLLLIKNRMFFMTLLIATQFILAFWCIGNGENVLSYTGVLFFGLFTLSGIERGYYILIVSLYLFFLPSLQGYELLHVITFICLIIIIVPREDFVNSAHLRIHFFNKVMFLFFIWINMSLLWCQNFSYVSASYYKIQALFLVYWLTIYFIRDEERLFNSLKVWIIIGALYSLARIVVQPTVQGETQDTFFNAKNDISSLINFSIFAFLPVFYMKNKRIPMIFLYILLSIMLIVNYEVGSRAGFLSLTLGVIIYFIIVEKKNSTRLRVIFLKILTFFICAFLLINVILIPSVFMNLHGIPLPFSVPSEYSTLLFRFEQWYYGKEMIESSGSYLLGLGMDGYGFLYSSFVEYDVTESAIYNHPHSFYVHAFCDYGIIGYLILAVLMISIILTLKKVILTTGNKPLGIVASAIYSGIVSFLIHGLADWSILEYRFWMFVGMGIAVALIDRNQNYKVVPFPVSRDQSPF